MEHLHDTDQEDSCDVSVRLVNVQEIAEVLGVPRSWVYRKTRTGDIPCIHVGKYLKFDANDVVAFLKEESNGTG